MLGFKLIHVGEKGAHVVKLTTCYSVSDGRFVSAMISLSRFGIATHCVSLRMSRHFKWLHHLHLAIFRFKLRSPTSTGHIHLCTWLSMSLQLLPVQMVLGTVTRHRYTTPFYSVWPSSFSFHNFYDMERKGRRSHRLKRRCISVTSFFTSRHYSHWPTRYHGVSFVKITTKGKHFHF